MTSTDQTPLTYPPHAAEHDATATAWVDECGNVHHDNEPRPGTKKEVRSKAPGDHRFPVTKKEETTDGPKVPHADQAMYAGILGDIVNTATPTTEADPVGIFASLLAGVGALVGSGPHLKIGNTRHPLLVWPLLFGRTGSGRKGEATNTAHEFLAHAEDRLWELSASGLSSGEGLIERIRDVADENDTGGSEDKRLLVIEPEFAAVMARSKRDGSTLAAVLRQAWDGGPLTVLNRASLRASASHVAITGHITPQEFRLRLAEIEMVGGTYNRFLPIYVERSAALPIPTGLPDATLRHHARLLATAITNASRPRLIRLDDHATALWCAEIYDEFTATDDEDHAWTEFTRRSAPYCLRIAALHAALDDRDHVTRNGLTAAAALVRYSIASAKYVLNGQHRDPRADKIRRALDAAGDHGMKRTDISALFSRNVPAAVLDELLAEITTDGSYQAAEIRTGGRPAVIYRATPPQ